MKSYLRVVSISFLGIVVMVTGFALVTHIVNAARTEHVAAPVPLFPPGAIWNQDISHAPVAPQSSTMINWLDSAGGWGYGRMQIDFSMRVLHANASTPNVRFRK